MRRTITSLLILALALLPGAAAAGPFTSIVVFGDSLSDAGRAFALSGGVFPPSPPYAQRFSNGPVAAEYLAGFLGLPLLPASTPGGTDFAVGGATTGTKNFNFEIDSPAGISLITAIQTTGMLTQVAQFLAAGPAVDRENALFVLWGGANDFFLAQALGGDLAVAAAAAVANLAAEVQALALGGARHFLIVGQPNIGHTPQFLGTPLEVPLGILTSGFNAGLGSALSAVEAGLEGLGLPVEITLFDTAARLELARADPAAVGFTNVTEACLANLAAFAAGCPGYLFFDGVHPTTQGHRFVATGLLTAIPAPPAALLVTIGAALVLVGRAVARRRAAA